MEIIEKVKVWKIIPKFKIAFQEWRIGKFKSINPEIKRPKIGKATQETRKWIKTREQNIKADRFNKFDKILTFSTLDFKKLIKFPLEFSLGLSGLELTLEIHKVIPWHNNVAQIKKYCSLKAGLDFLKNRNKNEPNVMR